MSTCPSLQIRSLGCYSHLHGKYSVLRSNLLNRTMAIPCDKQASNLNAVQIANPVFYTVADAR